MNFKTKNYKEKVICIITILIIFLGTFYAAGPINYSAPDYEQILPSAASSGTGICRPNGNFYHQWDTYEFTNIDEDVEKPDAGDGIKNSHSSEELEVVTDIFEMTTIDDADVVTSITIHLYCRGEKYYQGIAKIDVSFRFSTGEWSSVKSINPTSGMEWKSLLWDFLNVPKSDFDELQVKLVASVGGGLGGIVEVDVMYVEAIYRPIRVCRPNGNKQQQWEVPGYHRIDEDVLKPNAGDGTKTSHSGMYQNKVDIFHMTTLDKEGTITEITVHLYCGSWIYRGGYAKIKCSFRFGDGDDWKLLGTVNSNFGMGWKSFTWSGLSVDESDLEVLQIQLQALTGGGWGGSVTVDVMYAEITYEDDILDWGVDAINAERVWGGFEDALDIQTGGVAGDNVNVLIIDTGIDYNHDDLDDNYFYGIDLITDDEEDDTIDSGIYNEVTGKISYHGTKCAGIIGAEENDWGTIGVAPEVRIFVAKITNKWAYTSGDPSGDIAKAIEWGINTNMDIISLSWTTGYDDERISGNITAAYNAGIIFVASSGNQNGPVRYPAKYDDVIAVGAIDQNLDRASFSNYGPELDLMAPGVNIYTTDKGNIFYPDYGGTSAACPMVAGVVALILSSVTGINQLSGSEKVDAVRYCLNNSTTDLGAGGWDQYYGWGLVDAEAAVNYAIENY